MREKLIVDKRAILCDAEKKQARVRAYLEKNDLDGVVITTREHFAWVTGGGDNHVTFPTNIGFGAVVITRHKKYLVAHTMDAKRLMEEQIDEQGYEMVEMRWFEGDIRAKAKDLAGKRVGSDTAFSGCKDIYMDLVDMHYPMTDLEVARIRWLATLTDDIFSALGRTVYPGMTEKDIESKLWNLHTINGLAVDGMIVGSDDRCFKYRHPIATKKPLKRYLMLHSVARKWGLHCNLTRFVHFGKLSDEIEMVYRCATNIEARIFKIIEPGMKFSQILENQKKWYAEFGFENEWKNHFQGGPTGYVIADGGRSLTDKLVQVNQPYEWFITVTGTKTGELSLLTEDGLEISSFMNSSWPGRKVRAGSSDIFVPDILIR